MIGFTGTRKGMTAAQHSALLDLLTRSRGIDTSLEFHHGGCIGADAQAHRLALNLGYSIHLHPPVKSSLRALLAGSAIVIYPEMPYLERNRAIVDACATLIAAPAQNEEIIRSGTWSTVRYARLAGKLIVLIRPNGTFIKELICVTPPSLLDDLL